MDALCHLLLYDLIFGHPGVQVHDLSLQTSALEGRLHPVREIAMDIGLQNDLDIRNVSTIAFRDAEVAVAARSAVRARAASAV
jgi:hypothetical protein